MRDPPPGSTLIIPVGDVAQHLLLMLCFLAQNGYCIYDDVNRKPIARLERFPRLVNTDKPFLLTFIEQYALTELTAELAIACFAGMLMLQAMGLGGWMFDGIDRHAALGASGDPSVPGLGFHYDTDARWSIPNPTGLPGVYEGYCPPHYVDMRAAVEAVARRKFSPGGRITQKSLVLGKNAQRYVAACRCIAKNSRSASHCRLKLSTTASAKSPAPSRVSSV